jgi:hypothetical protein
MPNLNASGAAEVLTVSQHLVTAVDGLVDLTAQGENSLIHLQAESVSLETPGSYLSVLNSEVGGAVDIRASGEEACITLGTPTQEAGSQIIICPTGICLAYGLPESLAAIALTPTGLTLSVGPPETGALIEMTAGSILLKVGETEIALTPAGIVSKAPLIESSCEETKVSMGPQGISESVAEVSRSMTPAGHALSAAEVAVNVGVAGVTATGPTSSGEFEAAAEVSAATLTQAAQALASQEAPLTNIN